MQEFPLQSALGLKSDVTLQLTDLKLVMWGRDLQFSGLADSTPFELHFLDCREMRWQLYSHIQNERKPAFPTTELVNFKIGRIQHRSPAHLLTEHFGLSLVYGALDVHYAGEILQLGTE